MKPIVRAVIDVGTNSVKLLVAEVAGDEVRPLREESHQTRLGKDFFASRRLQPEPIASTAAAVANFAAEARRHGAVSVRVIATSAAREATNGADLVHAIEQASGLSVEIISGEQEAAWGYRGVCTDPILARESLLLLDVGGGSTEITIGHSSRRDFRDCFPLGTVRLLEQLRPAEPPAPSELAACRARIRQFLQTHAASALAAKDSLADKDLPGHALRWVGVGGTASILGCMEAALDTFDRERLESTRLTSARLRWHVERLWSLSLEPRKQIIGLPKNRADVILTGSAIFEAVAELFGFAELRISTRGLRFAALLDERA